MEVKAPRGQIIWELINGDNHILKYVVTSDKDRVRWFLYEVSENGELTKIESGKSPNFSKLGRE